MHGNGQTLTAAPFRFEGLPRNAEEQKAWSEYLDAIRAWRTQDDEIRKAGAKEDDIPHDGEESSVLFTARARDVFDEVGA